MATPSSTESQHLQEIQRLRTELAAAHALVHECEAGLRTLEEPLFFSMAPVFFTPVEGNAFPYAHDTIFHSSDPARVAVLKAAALERKAPMARLGEGYDQLAVDAIPVVDPEIVATPNDPRVSSWPVELRQPLLKTTTGPLQGYKSGVRSGLWRDPRTGKWYRLKGCGNNDQGFPVRTVMQSSTPPTPTLLPDGRELRHVRGAAYRHTAGIELLMSDQIGSALNQYGMQVANRPVGWYEYNIPCELPAIVRVCGVFETVGERRMADHVLAGLETLLPVLTRNLSADALARLVSFKEGPWGGPRPQGPEWDSMADGTFSFITVGQLDTNVANLVDLAAQPLPGLVPPTPSDFPAACSLHPEMRVVWNACCARLSEAKLSGSESSGSLLGYIYWRLGYEMGSFARALRDNGILWGTYQDLTAYHCNGHANNICLRREEPENPNSPFTCSLDFDMAYTRERCCFGESTPEADRAKCEEYARIETMSFLLNIGLDPGTTGTKNSHPVPASCVPLRWALRDTMVRGWLAAFNRTPDLHPADSNRYHDAYQLFKLALIITADVVA